MLLPCCSSLRSRHCQHSRLWLSVPYDNVQFGTSAAPTTPGVTVNLTTCIFGGEFRRVTNLVAGQTYRFSTCGETDFDTEITIYSAAGGTFQVENDDACGFQSEVDFTPTVSGDYDVLIDQFPCASNSICMTLNVTLLDTSPPANDNVCDAEALTIGVPAAINNEFATAEQFEPNPGPGTVGEAPTCNATDGWCSFELGIQNSVWYSFVAPASGCVSIEINGTTDLQLAVYAAPTCTNYFKFKDIAANDDGGPGLVPFLDYFSLEPGKTYYVQVDGYDGAAASGDEIVVLDGAGPVPAPWATGHIGTAVGDFSYVTCGEEYTLSTNQFTSAFKDQGGFILQTLCGDGYIQARLDGIDGSGWAGIVMRESGTAQGSRKVAMKTQLNNLVRRDVRKGTNGFAQSQQYPRPGGWDWLRIERVGDQFAGYISPDGENWQQVFATSFFMNNCLQVGMFVESINVNAVTTATFNNPEIGACPCISSFANNTYTGAYCGASTGTPGFPDDPACEAAVCAVDPFCCDVFWDGLCAAEAINDFPTECAACLSVGPPPATIGFGALQSDITQPEGTAANVERIGDLTVFPNPSDGIVNLKVADFIGKSATVIIYNSIGQEVYNKEFDVIEISTITADLTSPNITSGLYNLSFISEGQRVTKQVVISK
jgi:regulation of enolase protein 1 (concanavalin A-like superfamily)